MVFGNEFHENTRRRQFKTSHSVESLTSGSSDGESLSPRFFHERKNPLKRTKSFHEIIHEMSSSTKKLEEETSGLLRDMESLRHQNQSTGRRLKRLQKVSGAMKEQLQAFTPLRSVSQRHLDSITSANGKRNCYSSENLQAEI